MPLRDRLIAGLAIPAHPLALDASRRLDERRQRALTRYYLAAGAGGVAVGVHTTQFAIREPRHGLLRPVLELAAEEMRGSAAVKIAGLCGPTAQAVAEAELAASLGYDAGLLSLGALRAAPVEELLAHSRAAAAVLPIIGFYLQPSVGGRLLPFEFWRRFVEIENVVAVKIAPFSRYQTLDVVRAVALSGRAREIALYTGNDDNIVVDLLTEFRPRRRKRALPRRPAGPVGGVDQQSGRAAATHSLNPHGVGGRAGRAVDAGRPPDRCQRGAVRPCAPVPRMHCRHPRNSAPPGSAGWPLVPRSGGGAFARPGRGDRSRVHALSGVDRRRICARAHRRLAAVAVREPPLARLRAVCSGPGS